MSQHPTVPVTGYHCWAPGWGGRQLGGYQRVAGQDSHIVPRDHPMHGPQLAGTFEQAVKLQTGSVMCWEHRLVRVLRVHNVGEGHHFPGGEGHHFPANTTSLATLTLEQSFRDAPLGVGERFRNIGQTDDYPDGRWVEVADTRRPVAARWQVRSVVPVWSGVDSVSVRLHFSRLALPRPPNSPCRKG